MAITGHQLQPICWRLAGFIFLNPPFSPLMVLAFASHLVLCTFVLSEQVLIFVTP